MITHLHHLGWVVRSIDGALGNFASRQGLRLSGIEDHPGEPDGTRVEYVQDPS